MRNDLIHAAERALYFLRTARPGSMVDKAAQELRLAIDTHVATDEVKLNAAKWRLKEALSQRACHSRVSELQGAAVPPPEVEPAPESDELRAAAEKYLELTEMAHLRFQDDEHGQKHLAAKWRLKTSLSPVVIKLEKALIKCE